MPSYSKRQIIEAALHEIGLASYIFDMGADQLQAYVRRLDMQMATWAGMGVQVGWPLPGVDPEASDLDTETGLQDTAVEAVTCNLALAIAPSIGRTPMPDTRMRARAAFDVLLIRAVKPIQQQLPATLPRGQGQRYRQAVQPYFPEPVDPLSDAQAGEIEFE